MSKKKEDANDYKNYKIVLSRQWKNSIKKL